MAEICNTEQGKNESVRAYSWQLKQLLGKTENQLADGLKKRWFVEGLKSSLKRKMKIVPPSSYGDACKKAMDLEREKNLREEKE